MPLTSPGHASQTDDLSSARNMAVEPATRTKSPVADPTVCATETDAVVPRRDDVQKLDKKSTEYIIKSGLAGGLAGCAAKTLVGPLDRVKILFQASNPQFAKYTGSWFGVVTAMRDIYRVDGYLGLFRGHSATLLRIFPYAGIKFLAYEQVRARMIKDKSQETSVRRFLSGSIAGSISVLLTYPLEVIRVRLAWETKRDSRSSLRSICRQIYNEQPPTAPPQAPPHATGSARALARATTTTTSSTATTAAASTNAAAAVATAHNATPRAGLFNFYRGFTPTLYGMLPYAGASFLTHDAIGDVLRRPALAAYTVLPNSAGRSKDPDKPAQLKVWAELSAGGLAGFVSQTASYPLEVVRRRMQVGGVVGDGHRLRVTETARLIWRERGFRGFWVGLAVGYVKIVPMVATSFFVYERGKYYLGI